MIIAQPDLPALVQGFIPQKQVLNPGQLTMALGIVGATVMPHNLYLHSSISQSRKIDRTNPQEVATAVRFATWDSNIQLSAAFVVNCLLLILGSALFFGHSEEVGTFQRCMMPYKIQRSRERWLVQPLVFFLP